MEKPHRELELYGYSMVPRGGWRFTVAETGVSFQSPDPGGLAYSVRKHMDANDIAYPPDFKEWFEDELCRQNGRGEPWCGPKLKALDPVLKGLSIDDVSRFVTTLFFLAKDGFRMVPQEVADARSRICAACPLNVDVYACPRCYGFMAKVQKMLRGRKSEQHDKLKVCGACRCLTSIKVFIPTDVLDKAEAGDKIKWAPGCWRLKPDADA